MLCYLLGDDILQEKLNHIKADMDALVDEWLENEHLKEGQVFVIGCSTSEVAGEPIGTSGSEEVAAVLFKSLQRLRKEKGIHLAFQSCEHINRALVIERETKELLQLDEVTVIPVREAGGAMPAYAYQHFDDAVVVEHILADAGIDLGDTLIGMHLREVAVPIRLKQRVVGSAHVTGARTRPRLIGGPRAVYNYV